MDTLQEKAEIPTLWQRYAKVIFIGGLVVFITVLLVASVRMVNIAISTQSECVVERGEVEQDTPFKAAKHAC